MLSALQRFERKFVAVPESGCWLWEASVDRGGYGHFWIERYIQAHRAAFVLYRGEIPAGLDVLHRCDVPCCVNPSHLFLGTHRQNMEDRNLKGRDNSPFGVNRRKTHCRRGHEFTPENTYAHNGMRKCRACQRKQ